MTLEEKEKLFGKELTSDEVRELFPEAYSAWPHELHHTKFKVHTKILSAEAIGAGFVWEDRKWVVL